MSETIKSKIDLLRPDLPFIIKDINDRQYAAGIPTTLAQICLTMV